MIELSQSPTDPDFVQDPYRFYEAAREQAGSVFYWSDYKKPAVIGFAFVSAILRDRRFGRTPPPSLAPERPEHQKDFWAIEDHSMLELEPPRHTRLRKLVLHAFTSRRVNALAPEITALANELIDDFPSGEFDLLEAFASRLPVIIIARMLGVPEADADRLLAWSHDMVAMYQARRDYAVECAANRASAEFAEYIKDFVAEKRKTPGNDLISELIAAEEGGDKLSMGELISTCILLLNAGHEATVHTIGNGVKALLEAGCPPSTLGPVEIDDTIEEIFRFDTPLHMFTRYAYEDVQLGNVVIPKDSEVACLLGAANRDPSRWDEAHVFDPARLRQTHVSFGAGTHFCIGAPLARLELQMALPVLFERCPQLGIKAEPRYAQTYHFHGLEELRVST